MTPAPAPGQDWTKLDRLFAAADKNYERRVTNPAVIAAHDEWTLHFRTLLDGFGLDTGDPATAYIVSVATVTVLDQLARQTLVLGDERTLGQVQAVAETFAWALRGLRQHVESSHVMLSLEDAITEEEL